MASKKRARQRARKTANPYGTSPAENPYTTTPGATQQVPGTSNAGPTPDQAVPGMKDDMGDGTQPLDSLPWSGSGQRSNAGVTTNAGLGWPGEHVRGMGGSRSTTAQGQPTSSLTNWPSDQSLTGSRSIMSSTSDVRGTRAATQDTLKQSREPRTLLGPGRDPQSLTASMGTSSRPRTHGSSLGENVYASPANDYASPPGATGATTPMPQGNDNGPLDPAMPGTMMDPNAGRNGQAMANKVALHCFGCGAEGWVGLDKVARIGEDGKQLTCQVCKSTDLDVLDRDPVVSARQRQAMQRQAIWPQEQPPAAPYKPCAECGKDTQNSSGLCDRCRKSYEDESKESSLHARRVARLVQAATAQRCDNCGHTIRSNVPNEQGWECPKCHEGTMQDVKESAHKQAGPYDTKFQPGDMVGYRYSPGDAVIYTNWNGAEGRATVVADPADGMPNDAFVQIRTEDGDEYPRNRRELTPAGTRAWEDAERARRRGGAKLPKWHQAFSEPPMGHLSPNPTPEEIMAKAEAIPLPIKRLPPRQQQQTAQVVSAILGTNPGLNRVTAWKVAYKTVTGLEA